MQDAIYQVAPDMGRGRSSIHWLELAPGPTAALDKAMAAWLGTPYQSGQRARKMGVDCAQLIPGILDMLFKNQTPTKLARRAPDAGVHSIRPGMATAKSLRRSFPSVIVRDNTIEPGDIIIVRASGLATGPRRLGHALMAGTQPMTAIHASLGNSVCMTTLATAPIVRVYRPNGKEGWSV